MTTYKESEHVSRNLHKWVNLIFGVKQRGQKAIDAQNVFFYLTYPDAVNLENIKDVHLRLKILTLEHLKLKILSL